MSEQFKPTNIPLPCPFCGRDPVVEIWRGGGDDRHLVSCDCTAGPGTSCTTRDASIAAWNLRAQARPPDDPTDELELVRLRHRLTGRYLVVSCGKTGTSMRWEPEHSTPPPMSRAKARQVSTAYILLTSDRDIELESLV